MGCTECPLKGTSITGRFKGRGSNTPKIIIVGDSPNKTEDAEGLLCRGRNFDLIKETIGDISDVYFTNVVKCTPYIDAISHDMTRTPNATEIAACRQYLLAEIKLLAGPDTIIVPLGNAALSALISDNGGITKELGKLKPLDIEGVQYRVVANYHPSAIFRQMNLKADFARVFKSVRNGDLKEYSSDNIEYKILTPTEAIAKAAEVLELYRTGKIVDLCSDTETNSLNPIDGKVVMFSFSHEADDCSYSVPIFTCNDMNESHFAKFGHYPDFHVVTDQERALIKQAWKPVFETIPQYGHNWKFDLKMLHTNFFLDKSKVTVCDDTMLDAFITYGRTLGYSLGLKELSKKLFNITVDWDVEVDQYLGLFKKVADRLYSNIKTSLLGKYAAYDVHFNKLLRRELKSRRIGGQEAIYQQLLEATIVFADIELNGCSVDMNLLTMLHDRYTAILTEIQDKIFELPTMKTLVDRVFAEQAELNKKRRIKWPAERIKMSCLSLSGRLLRTEIFYDLYKFPVLVKTPSGMAGVGTDALKALQEECTTGKYGEEAKEFISLLLQWINIDTVITKYTSKIELDMIDGLYYTDFNLIGTVTGRLSSAFHMIPSKSDVKKVFNSRWASEGGVVIPADYSQLELRVMAGLSNEPVWIEAYKRGIDLHLNTAAEVVFKKPHAQVTKAERKVGKILNFGIVYGRGAASVAVDLDIAKKAAQAYLDTFFAGVPTLVEWMESRKQFARDNGFIVTPFNRIIAIPEVYSKEHHTYEHGMRAAVNYSVQSPASDLGLTAICKIWRQFKAEGLRSLIIGMVHDSILVDAYPTEIKAVARIMKAYGEDFVNGVGKDWLNGCPIVLDMSMGHSWGFGIEGTMTMKGDELSFHGEDMEKSWRILKNSIGKNYNIVEVIHNSKDLTDKDFSMENVVRSPRKIEATITITEK